jgi:transposase
VIGGIGSTRSLRVFAYTVPTDMRKGFDGLYGMVTSELERDPMSGDLFLFVSRDRKRARRARASS